MPGSTCSTISYLTVEYTQTAIALSARHAENPLFLKRNLEYVKRFSKASQGNRKPFSLSERYSKEDLALQIYRYADHCTLSGMTACSALSVVT